MNTMMQFYDRSVRVELSKVAARTCARHTRPLLLEMELRFGCLVTKRACFRNAPLDTTGVQVDEQYADPHGGEDYRSNV